MSDTRRIEVSASELAHGVPESDYLRLLAWPPNRPLSPPLQQRARGAREWYAQHGRPFLAARRLSIAAIAANRVTLETGDVLTGSALADQLHAFEADALAVVAASSGAEATQLAERMWADGRPDEGFFLDRLAAGVTELLLQQAGSLLFDPSGPATEYASRHLSPGSSGWELADQSILVRLLSDRDPVVCGPITLLDSGALDPAHSALAVYGLAGHPPAG